MKEAKNLEYIPIKTFNIKWNCPYCGVRNDKEYDKNILANRLKCWRCGKYCLKKEGE